ncbi:MAG: hypothetical protein GXY33_12485 [Phycisphaerae bacterium]|nr:hypothetical protein [Phycisphaerae bacterium]
MTADTNIAQASISFRIGTPLWMPEPRFRELLELFRKYRGVTDEITFFTSETHPPLPLEVIRRRSELLVRRMVDARTLGCRSGINILATIGHHEENLPNSLQADYPRATDIDGRASLGSFCPSDEPFRRDYVVPVYQALAAAEPDYIWIDDDVRQFGHLPILYTCFCDACIERFSREIGQAFTRESLKQAINDAPLADKLQLRQQWLVHQRRIIHELFALIEQTVHAVKPGLPLGFMTGDRFWEGYDFDGWTDTLAGPERAEVLWRPGGGFYRDECMSGLVDKSHAAGRQCAFLPPTVVRIQSEIENFPYQRLRKAEHVTALEAASHIAAGCTGAAFNVLSMYDEPLDEYHPLVATLLRHRPFFDRLAVAFQRSACLGVRTGWNKDTAACTNLDSGDWFHPDDPLAWLGLGQNEFFELGIPAAYAPDGACVTLLSGTQPYAFSHGQLEKLLSGGVMLDGPALENLNRLGFGELTGFAVKGSFDRDAIEQLADHTLNAPFAGRCRDGRQSFHPGIAYALEPTDANAQTLSRLIDYAARPLAGCAAGVFENRLGGRVVVAGYYPWQHLQNLSKATQIKTLVRWLSKDALPALVQSYHKINLWTRRTADGRIATALINASLDPAENIQLLLQTQDTKIAAVDMSNREQSLVTEPATGPYRRLTIPRLAPWHMVLLL